MTLNPGLNDRYPPQDKIYFVRAKFILHVSRYFCTAEEEPVNFLRNEWQQKIDRHLFVLCLIRYYPLFVVTHNTQHNTTHKTTMFAAATRHAAPRFAVRTARPVWAQPQYSFTRRSLASGSGSISVGDTLPSGIALHQGFPPQKINIQEYCADKKVVLLGLPGAFTPTWSTKQIPNYLEHQDALRGLGIQHVIVWSVNDAAVMLAWVCRVFFCIVYFIFLYLFID